jgi:DNA invertase Pin-like site-specific DNA recombinase
MTTIGYARVSTTDQDLEIQIAALKREGCTTIRSEKRSGTTTANREELRTVLDFLREHRPRPWGFIEGDRTADRH